jgi:hypothetical protein
MIDLVKVALNNGIGRNNCVAFLGFFFLFVLQVLNFLVLCRVKCELEV